MPPAAAPPLAVPTPSPESARAIWLFFGATLAISWSLQVPAALSRLGLLSTPVSSLMPLVGLGIFGPTLGAVIATLAEPGSGGPRALFGRLGQWRVGPVWYAIALAMPPVILAAGMAAYTLATGRDEPWVYFPSGPERIAAFFVVPFAEEIGWRGFALPRLQRRMGPLPAALLLGTVWAVWHVPMLLIQDTPHGLLPLMLAYFVAGSVAFSWIFNHTGGSLLLMVIAHMGAHLAQSHRPLPANPVPFLAQMIGYVVVATGLVLIDRKVWRRQDPAIP